MRDTHPPAVGENQSPRCRLRTCTQQFFSIPEVRTVLASLVVMCVTSFLGAWLALLLIATFSAGFLIGAVRGPAILSALGGEAGRQFTDVANRDRDRCADPPHGSARGHQKN